MGKRHMMGWLAWAATAAMFAGCDQQKKPAPELVGDASTNKGLLLLQQEKPASESIFQPFKPGPNVKGGSPLKGSLVKPGAPLKPVPPNQPKAVKPYKPGPAIKRVPPPLPTPGKPRTPPKPPAPPPVPVITKEKVK